MKPRSIRFKLTLWFILIFTSIILVSDYFTYRSLQRITLKEMDADILSMATLESVAFKEDMTLDLDLMNRQTQQYPLFLRQVGQVIDATGKVVLQFGIKGSDEPVLTPSQITEALAGQPISTDGMIDDKAVRLGAVSIERQSGQYVIVIGTNTEKLRFYTDRMAWSMLGMDFLTVILTVAGGYFITGKVLKSVEHIANRAHEIGTGNLKQRLQQIDSSAEMTHLTNVLNEMLSKLENLFEGQKQFLQDVSHEIRSPLAALQVRLEVALRQPRTVEEYRQVLQVSLQDTLRLSNLANDLLLLAQADQSGLSLELQEVSITKIISEVYENLQPLAQARQIRLLTDYQSSVPCSSYGDRRRLYQVFRNLVENALHYTPAGGLVTLTVKADGEEILVIVEDTGVGIPVEEQAKIFDRFYRVDRARSRSEGGTGLGLAICEQIIREHQGKIEVVSSPGNGARFTVHLSSAAALTEEVT